MSTLNKNLQIITDSRPSEANIVAMDGFRITVITPQLVRVEVEKNNLFTDEATQSVWVRNLGEVSYKVTKKDGILAIITEKVGFLFDINQKKMVSVVENSEEIPVSNRSNLKGTARTLDFRIDGVKLGAGVIGKEGVAVIDDSRSLLLIDSEIRPRERAEEDYYVFAYGKEYRAAVQDLYRITGAVPLLPRYALGNWWSRYRAYTQEEYLSLMDKFEKKDIPITVATVDMDWHWVRVNEKFGTDYKSKNPLQPEGWTGYTWNSDLFPDYKEFLQRLHEHNYHVTLNLHPASGVRPYESMYEEMATKMGIDPSTKKTVEFDLSDNNFINNYFDILHHPYEKEGVDFWWMDWQQGKKSTVDGLDPLWALNHYHFIDNGRDNKRPMLLSRYSGVGSHRYPLGFSGDTIACWDSLKFQPYFTNTAANIGYGWWSHDIGGHQLGSHNDELYIRWCQYGVFSPINRLHSTNHDLQGKEPWNYRAEAERIVSDFLRLRHKLIPYVYTMNYRAHTEGIALCEPMYYSYPSEPAAYKVPDQYFFGSELMVSPVVSKNSKILNMAKTRVWIPEGRFTDIFTDRIYQGNKFVNMFRDWDTIPVLAKEGAIIPMSKVKGNSTANPAEMDLLIYRGNSSFKLYEDDGESNNYKQGKSATTEFNVREKDDRLYFEIMPVEGDRFCTVGKRKYTLHFKDVVKANCRVVIDENELDIDFCEAFTVAVPCSSQLKILLTDCVFLTNPDGISEAKRVLSRYQRSNLIKMAEYAGMSKITEKEEFRKAIKKSHFPKIVKEAVFEVLE